MNNRVVKLFLCMQTFTISTTLVITEKNHIYTQVVVDMLMAGHAHYTGQQC